MFGVEDLFVAGIGFDVVGAWLLARGLVASPGDLALRTASFWGGNPIATASQIEDRVRGQAGVRLLVLGFLLQAVAYAFVIRLDNPSEGTVAGVVIAGLVPILAATCLSA